MRVRREPRAVAQLAAEVVELLERDPALEVGAGVDARRGVPLEVDDVAVAVLALALEEVVEADLVQRRGRGVGRDVAADPLREPVGAHDHGHGVPADQALDAPLDLLAAGQRRLVLGADRVDVGGDGRERQRHAGHPGVVAQRGEQPPHAAGVPLLEDVIERLPPLALFDSLELGSVAWSKIFHERFPSEPPGGAEMDQQAGVPRLQPTYCSPAAGQRPN
jgi:hypothetical protein